MNKADRWQLPEGVEELLPAQAAAVERLRRQLLDLYASWGYQLVIPPLMEFTESLLIGLGDDIDTQSFKVIDQISGRMLAIRADITPQTARIDAHSLAAEGAQRLCYAGSVLHTRPSGLMASRSPIQLGAELYGDDSVRADIEVISLMLASLQRLNIEKMTLDLGHVAFYRELLAAAKLDADQESQLFQLMQEKNLSDLPSWLQENVADDAQRDALLQLAQLNGDKTVLESAASVCAGNPVLEDALQQLQAVISIIEQRYPDVAIYLDLSELRGYHYHTGLVFATFCEGSGRAIANGGRYDHIGEVFGRARPATGFNADLKTLMAAAHAEDPAPANVIAAPDDEDQALWVAICALRDAGDVVVQMPKAQMNDYSRRLVKAASGDWQLETV